MSKRQNPNKALLDNLFGGQTESLLKTQMGAGEPLCSETLTLTPVEAPEQTPSESSSRQEKAPVPTGKGNPKDNGKPSETRSPERKPMKEERRGPREETGGETDRKYSSRVDYEFYARLEPESILKLKAICRKESTSMSGLISEVIEKCIRDYEEANGEVSTRGIEIRGNRKRRKKVFGD